MVNSNAVVPYVLATIVCDEDWRDPSTGKLTLLGIFNTMSADAFPLHHPQVVVYFALTDGRERFPITVHFVAVGEHDDVIAEASSLVVFDDPRAIHEGEIRLSDVVFGGPGEYRFQLSAGSELLYGA